MSMDMKKSQDWFSKLISKNSIMKKINKQIKGKKFVKYLPEYTTLKTGLANNDINVKVLNNDIVKAIIKGLGLPGSSNETKMVSVGLVGPRQAYLKSQLLNNTEKELYRQKLEILYNDFLTQFKKLETFYKKYFVPKKRKPVFTKWT